MLLCPAGAPARRVAHPDHFETVENGGRPRPVPLSAPLPLRTIRSPAGGGQSGGAVDRALALSVRGRRSIDHPLVQAAGG